MDNISEIESIIKDYLKQNLTLDINSTESYTGGTGSESLYETRHTVQLRLDGEVISEIDL